MTKLLTWRENNRIACLGNMPVGICILAGKRGRTERWAVECWLPNDQGGKTGCSQHFPSEQTAKNELEYVAAEWLRSAGLSPRRDGPIVDRFSPDKLIEIADRTNVSPASCNDSDGLVYEFEDGWTVFISYYEIGPGQLWWIEHDGKRVFEKSGDDYLTRQFSRLRYWQPSANTGDMQYELVETDDGDRLRALKAHPRSARGRR
ncbi:hypothetical protein HFO32_22205 [Rhizobium leguminosarum]|uniref:hypothetical protein n=1 Tax=Rhizobium leguminosarum TaxID=384 RepID=UPI001C955994|nr:hypothetical protein [Rhizobium leguminosarum]MBY5684839.1 hypothetical protein [Rhizobium leguminosarum]